MDSYPGGRLPRTCWQAMRDCFGGPYLISGWDQPGQLPHRVGCCGAAHFPRAFLRLETAADRGGRSSRLGRRKRSRASIDFWPWPERERAQIALAGGTHRKQAYHLAGRPNPPALASA